MSKASTKAKRRYNNQNYGSIHVWIDKDKVAEFKRYVKEMGISQAEAIECLIDYEYIGAVIETHKRNKAYESEKEQKREERRKRDRERQERFKKTGRYTEK